MSRKALFLSVFWGIWTFCALLTTSQLYIEHQDSGTPMPWGRTIMVETGKWYSWGLLTPLIIWLSRRIPIERKQLSLALPFHISASILIAALHTSFLILLERAVGPPARRPLSFSESFVGHIYALHFEIFTYWAILGAGYGLEYYRKFRERELRASQLEAQLAQARLETLKMQIQPHFLFNTLHSIAALVRKKEDSAAINMIGRLSDLLRQTLDRAVDDEVPLKHELDLLDLYLDIQQVRFSDRLTIRVNVSPEALDVKVPNLILQPIVENAIRHGISPRAGPATLELAAEREADALRLSVFNDGRPLPDGWRPDDSGGIGLANTRARLQQLYGARHSFSIANAQTGGVVVTIKLPWHSDGEQRLSK